MDGDDAVEFFREFGEKFTVDLHGLYANWERHFLPEGGSGGLTTIAVICGCITAGFMLKDFVGVSSGLGMGNCAHRHRDGDSPEVVHRKGHPHAGQSERLNRIGSFKQVEHLVPDG